MKPGGGNGCVLLLIKPIFGPGNGVEVPSTGTFALASAPEEEEEASFFPVAADRDFPIAEPECDCE